MTEAGRAAVLAIDGGNSKTDVALVGADGSILGVARGGNSNHQGVGRAGMVAVLNELVQAATVQANTVRADSVQADTVQANTVQANTVQANTVQAVGPGRGPVAEHVSACLAGADLPEEEAELGALIQAQGWSVTSSVVNDTFAVLRAGLQDAGEPGGAGTQRHWGIGVVCGAGINCVGVAPDGRTTRFLALGQISGDWGGGEDLGPEALWWAIRAEDGRGPQTELRIAVPAHFGVDRVEDVVIGLYLGKINYEQLHGLVPVLYKVAGNGDEAASSVVLRLADEVSRMATVAATRLGLTDQPQRARHPVPVEHHEHHPVPVVLGGSLLTARDPLLTGAIHSRLAETIPGADVRIADVPPIAGAALLGLDHVGAPPAAAARLRESAAATW